MGTRTFSRLRFLSWSAFGVAAIACGSGSSDQGVGSASGPASSSSSSSSSSGAPAPAPSPPPSGTVCNVGTSVCVGKDKTHACVDGSHWVDAICPVGSGCFQGACTPSRCSDECTLGEVESGTGKTCKPWSVAGAASTSLDPASKQHDRARDYLGWMKRGAMLSGAIGSAHFTDPGTWSTVDAMHGIGDSAIWTGTFLASEAFRLRATGSPSARSRVRALVDTMHLWLNVAGEPGMLVRWAKESTKTFPFSIPDYDCSATRVHCGVDYQGKKYDFIGHISRDQYQGVMLGLATAYDALDPIVDADARAIIRDDVVTIVRELMKERTVSVRLTFNGVKMSPQNVTARFIVLSPREMVDGAIDLRVDLNKPDDSEMFGFQEFYPNLAHLVRQLGGLSWVPDIKRASSAIMLASFFRAALHMTDGVASSAKDHADILAYYTGNAGQGGNVSDWLDVAKTWSAGNSCGNGYYANNITMMPFYTLARLEDDPVRAQVLKDISSAKLWPAFEKTKNSFFSFIYAGVTPGAPAAITSSASSQLAQFPVAPRVQRMVDLRASPKYTSREAGCTDQVKHDDAVDVGDRATGDFMWQRHPWGLLEYGDDHQTEPGVDFLVAYFMGMSEGFITDDTPSTCLAWQ